MKRNIKRTLSVILSLVMVFGMIPLSASASEETEITNIGAHLRDSECPLADKEVVLMQGSFITASGKGYKCITSEGYWFEENGSVINQSTVGTGYCFENGKTYCFDAYFEAESGYKFALEDEINIVSLDNDFPLFTYDYIDAKVLSVSNDQKNVAIRYFFTLSGTNYKRIKKVNLSGQGYLTEGGSYKISLGYHNCSIEFGKWKGELKDGLFSLGKYSVTIDLAANNGYTFADDVEIAIINESNGKVYECSTKEIGDDYTDITVTFDFEITDSYNFEVQFPEGAGESANNPAVCNNYWEFKSAMENEFMPYVALGDCNEFLPAVKGEELLPGAISVRGFKNLYLTGDAVFTAPEIFEDGYCDYDALLYNTYPQAEFRIYGPGSLTYCASGESSKNAVISIANGSVYIYGGTIKGSFNSKVSSKAIWMDLGTLKVFGGTVKCESGSESDETVAAVHAEGGIVNILEGDFSATASNENALTYGLSIGAKAKADLSGGTFKGILLPTSSTPLENYMDKEIYTPYTNGSWFNPESEYSQEYTASGKKVEIFRVIKEVDVNINAPSVGKAISFDIYNCPLGSAVSEVKWYKNGVEVKEGTFTAGDSYKAVICFKAYSNSKFASDLTSATINFSSAAIIKNDGETLELAFDFGECPATVNNVELTIDAPMQHAKPDQSVVCANGTYLQAQANDNMLGAPLLWMESSDNKNWYKMDLNSTFTVGYYYKVYVDLKPATGYEFAIDSHFEPYVTAKVNGYAAKVSRYPEADPSELINVYYYFGQLNDNIIEQIDIEGVSEPVVGEKPDYNCAIAGIGYTVNTAYSNGTYIINGIGWKDVTDDKWLYPDDTFEIDHEYRIYIDVKAKNGYEFYTSGSSFSPEGWGYINGNYATLGVQSLANKEQSLSWTFACQSKTVKSVAVTDLELPKDGASPDFYATVDSEYCTVESIMWLDYENDLNEMTEEDTFVEGNKYYLRITVSPFVKNGKKYCKFIGSKTTATLNGAPVTAKNDGWTEVTSSVNTVTIYCIYTCKSSENFIINSATAEITVPRQDSTPSFNAVLGNESVYEVKEFYWYDGFGNKLKETDEYVNGITYSYEITLKVKDGVEGSFASYTKCLINGNKADETILSVDFSEITLKGEFTCGSNIQFLPGDVNADGKVDTTDLAALKLFLAGAVKEGGIDKNGADLNNDTKVDTTDLASLKLKLAGI